LWNQLVERGLDAEGLQRAVEAALAKQFGDKPCRMPQSAHVLVAH
jgi:hypothetical protein